MGNNCIGGGREGVEAIADAMHVSTSLKNIDLSLNRLGPNGGKRIAEGIAVSTSLMQVLAVLCTLRSLVYLMKRLWCMYVAQINLSSNELCGAYTNTQRGAYSTL